MVNRRQFIDSGVAACVAGGLLGAAHAGASEAPRTSSAAGAAHPAEGIAIADDIDLRVVLFDERFATARRFGDAARGRGVPAHAIRGDVTDIWYSRLHPLWKREPAAVAGCTAYAAVFCLERLAWDHGLRVIRRGTLGEQMGQPLHSWVIGPRERIATRNL